MSDLAVCLLGDCLLRGFLFDLEEQRQRLRILDDCLHVFEFYGDPSVHKLTVNSRLLEQDHLLAYRKEQLLGV